MTEAPITLMKRQFPMSWAIFVRKIKVNDVSCKLQGLRKPRSDNSSLSDPKLESRETTFFRDASNENRVFGRVPNHATVPSPVSPATRFRRELPATARFEDGKFMVFTTLA